MFINKTKLKSYKQIGSFKWFRYNFKSKKFAKIHNFIIWITYENRWSVFLSFSLYTQFNDKITENITYEYIID